MSRATLTVTFPDGHVRYGVYNGTSDFAYPDLFGTVEEAWAASDHPDFAWVDQPDQVHLYPVRVHSTYGNGFDWDGMACDDRLVVGRDPFGDREILT